MEQRYTKTLRAAGSIVVATAIAFTLAWPFAHLTPIFVWNFVKQEQQFTLKDIFSNLVIVSASCVLGLVMSIGALHNHVLFLVITSLLLWLIFYTEKKHLSSDARTWLIIGLTLVPFLAIQSQAVTLTIIRGLLLSVTVAAVVAWLTWYIFPLSVGENAAGTNTEDVKNTGESVRRTEATVNLIMVIPPILFIYLFNLPDKILVMMFIALLVPAFNADSRGAISAALLAGNMIGGIAGIVVYAFALMAPEPLFFLILYWITSLFFCWWAFSGQKTAPLGDMALTTAMLIAGGATLPFSSGAEAAAMGRLFNIFLVVLYFWVVLRIHSALCTAASNAPPVLSKKTTPARQEST